jgi:flagellar basal body-associated protein FliL
MLSQAKTGKKTVIVIATLILIAAGSIVWSRSGSTEHQEAAKNAKAAAEASVTISPLEITLERGKNLPAGSWGDPF